MITAFCSMAGHKRTRGSQDINGRGVPLSIPVIGTPIRPPLSNLNPNTPVLRQSSNHLPLGVPARVSSDATTRVDTSEQSEEENNDDVQSGPSAPPNTMYTEMSPEYFRSREDETLNKGISQPRSNSKPYRRNKQNIDSFGFPAGESSKAFCSRVKTLVHHYLRDVHVKWIIIKKGSACSNIMGKMRKQFPGQWNDACVYAMISSLLRQKVCKLRKLAISGGKFLTYHYDICSFYFFIIG